MTTRSSGVSSAHSNGHSTTTLPSTPSKTRRSSSRNSKLRIFLIVLCILLVTSLISQALFFANREDYDISSAVESALDYANQEFHYIESQVKQQFDHDVSAEKVNVNDERRNENRTMREHGVLMKTETTIVTAYFSLKAKHSSDSYQQWMKNMLGMQDAMVIFTSDELVETMLAHRSHALNRTVVISMPLEHTPMAQNYPERFWKAQLEQDPERNIHRNYEVFWIWLSKSWFVWESIQRNYFDSQIYMWCDIGSFRTSKYKSKALVKYTEMIPQHSILFMAHHDTSPPPKPVWNDKHRQKQHFYHSGSHAIGYRDTWLEFHKAFLKTVDAFVERKMFLGEDQAVLQSTCLLNPNLCMYVKASHVQDNHYWGLRHVLHHGGNYTYWQPPGAENTTQLVYLSRNKISK